MIEWFLQNIGTIFVFAFLIAVISFVIVLRFRDKKNGKNSCGGACENCALCSKCHSSAPAPKKAGQR